ncbi:uncharacterized protein LOC115527680 [Lynx canadensis]|uniref:uncharacterized protein LOC115527680 n=1 Tax=Lynx canadensis TaxID=61383 RepID=UPI0013C4BA20|nr:uncharacterized protein LOC115527680 [Lynx canadensis]
MAAGRDIRRWPHGYVTSAALCCGSFKPLCRRPLTSVTQLVLEHRHLPAPLLRGRGSNTRGDPVRGGEHQPALGRRTVPRATTLCEWVTVTRRGAGLTAVSPPETNSGCGRLGNSCTPDGSNSCRLQGCDFSPRPPAFSAWSVRTLLCLGKTLLPGTDHGDHGTLWILCLPTPKASAGRGKVKRRTNLRTGRRLRHPGSQTARRSRGRAGRWGVHAAEGAGRAHRPWAQVLGPPALRNRLQARRQTLRSLETTYHSPSTGTGGHVLWPASGG